MKNDWCKLLTFPQHKGIRILVIFHPIYLQRGRGTETRKWEDREERNSQREIERFGQGREESERLLRHEESVLLLHDEGVAPLRKETETDLVPLRSKTDEVVPTVYQE